MNKELNIFTLRMLREQYQAEHLDTEAEALDAAIEALEQPTDGDCISRQATIDAICKACNELFFDQPCEPCDCEIRNAVNDMPSAQPEPQWIPCSERLPEENGQYIITVKYKHVNDSYEDVYAEHGEWYDGRWDMFCFGHCGEVEDITAWMPLPGPWRGEE